MSASESRAVESPWWSPIVQSLLPTAAFVAPTLIADAWADDQTIGGILLFSLGFITIPALLAIAAARPGRTRAAVVGVLTLLAGAAAAVVLTSNDAQAGIAVVWIPVIALPLALLLFVVRIATRRRD